MRVTIIEGEGWSYAFPTQAAARRFRDALPVATIRPLLDALAVDHRALGRIEPDGRLDRTFGGVTTDRALVERNLRRAVPALVDVVSDETIRSMHQ